MPARGSRTPWPMRDALYDSTAAVGRLELCCTYGYGGGCAGCAVVGRGLFGRGPRLDGRRVDGGRRAAAPLLRRRCPARERAGRAGSDRPVGDDGDLPGG